MTVPSDGAGEELGEGMAHGIGVVDRGDRAGSEALASRGAFRQEKRVPHDACRHAEAPGAGRPASPSGGAPGGQSSRDPAQQLVGVRVLLVEDDVWTQEALALYLGTEGAVVIPAGTVAEAMAAFDAEPPAVLVSDIGLPGEDGYGLIRRVREREQRGEHRLPALAMSGFARHKDEPKALAAGFDDFLPKPFEPDLLVARIRRLLGDGPQL